MPAVAVWAAPEAAAGSRRQQRDQRRRYRQCASGAGSPFDCNPATGAPNLKLTELVTGLQRPLLAVSPRRTTALVRGRAERRRPARQNGTLAASRFSTSAKVTDSGNEQGCSAWRFTGLRAKRPVLRALLR
jgi:hypothetical protein